MIARVGRTDLLEQHARLLFDLDRDGRIVAVNEPEPDPPPLLWLGRSREGSLVLGRVDIPDEVQGRGADRVAALAPWAGTPTPAGTSALDDLGVGGGISGGPAFRFPERLTAPPVDGLVVVDGSTAPLLEPSYPFTRRYVDALSPVTGIIRDGAIVATCTSCRTRPNAGEVGLHTTEAWRGRGFGRALVAAWHAALVAAGRTPWYSTTWDNAASLAVARSLGLELVAEELSLG
ncbi:MAG: GNAT family N-acetyltransferase [Chloroflexi bacterium]|nr:GNAT family N-acetyltransferase [Chloroflexota bacterium]